MVKLQIIWKKQLDFVTAIANDLIKNECSEEAIKYAKQYAHVVEEDLPDFIRVNWGEAYAYINFNEKTAKYDSITYLNDEMAGIEGTTYDGTIKQLDALSDEAIMNSEFYDCYLEYEGKEEEYTLSYEPKPYFIGQGTRVVKSFDTLEEMFAYHKTMDDENRHFCKLYDSKSNRVVDGWNIQYDYSDDTKWEKW